MKHLLDREEVELLVSHKIGQEVRICACGDEMADLDNYTRPDLFLFETVPLNETSPNELPVPLDRTSYEHFVAQIEAAPRTWVLGLMDQLIRHAVKSNVFIGQEGMESFISKTVVSAYEKK